MARFHIVRGPPNVEEFKNSLFEGDGLSRKPMELTMVEPDKPDQQRVLQFVVDGLEREDGSGQNWLFQGCCRSNEERFNGVYGKGFLSFEKGVSSGWIDL